MYKAYTGKQLRYSLIPLLFPNFGHHYRESWLHQNNAFKLIKKPFVSVVNTPQQADFFLVPHHYFLIEKHRGYLKQFIQLSEKYKKKIVVFHYGDPDNKVLMPNSVVFRTSQYRCRKKSNEIIMPAYVEDLGKKEIHIRKKHKIPEIGFCGWAEFQNIKEQLLFTARALPWHLLAKIYRQSHFLNHQPGIIIRKEVISRLNNTAGLKRNFIIRSKFSGYAPRLTTAIEKFREQYVNNLNQSDIALVLRGDGNFSQRFYEALSLGRIVASVETENLYPLEDKIPYREFVIHIPYENIDTIENAIINFYRPLTNSSFLEKQKKARHYFSHYLRIDRFFKIMFYDKLLNEYL